MPDRSLRLRKYAVLILASLLVALLGAKCKGMTVKGFMELQAAGVNKYVRDFAPATSEPSTDGWTKHTFDPDGGNGPTCIDGSPFTVFTKERDPKKVVIFLNGGGACWQDFYFCSIQANQDPPAASGIFADSFDAGGGNIVDNPLADWSMMFVSYCDGSVFTGDNAFEDPNPTWAAIAGTSTRTHRGVRNVTAALDLARRTWPEAKKGLLTGSSAGGFGVAALSPGIFRFVYPPSTQLLVLDDSGPPVQNPGQGTETIVARANDWAFEQFYPASCTGCDIFGQPAAAAVDWRHDNDHGVEEALYTTDGDQVIRFFLQVPTQAAYRDLVLSVTDPLVAEHPDSYRRFVRSGSTEHTLLRDDLFYTAEADGVAFTDWVDDFVNDDPGWVDIVEDFIPAP